METKLSAEQQGHSSRQTRMWKESWRQEVRKKKERGYWKRLRHIHKEKAKDKQTGSGVKTSGLDPTTSFHSA